MIIVCHRLAVVTGCDRIAVVEDKGISAVGTFDEMIENSPYFASAWKDYIEARNTRYEMGGDL